MTTPTHKPKGRPRLTTEQKTEARVLRKAAELIERRDAKATRIEQGRRDYLRRKMEEHPVGDTVTRRQLTYQIAVKTGLKFKDVDLVIEETLLAIHNHLAAGRRVSVQPFGSFSLKRFKAKSGRNPRDPSREIPVAATTKVQFKPGLDLREATKDINPGNER